MTMKNYDFSGYATKNNLKCTDGRMILKDAFKDQDGKKVPLVWQHGHSDPANILGHAILENREDGVYAYCKFNDTPSGKNAKMIVEHGDVEALSIWANQLVEKAKQVMHGAIREVSLVLTGANPGARIDNVNIAHSDGSETELDDEAIIYANDPIAIGELAHADKEDETDDEKTVGDVFDTLTEEQKTVVYALIAEAMNTNEKELDHADKEDESNEDETLGDVFNTLTEKQKTVVYAMIAEIMDSNEAEHSDEEGENFIMKHNVFDNNGEEETKATLTHAQFDEIVADAKKCGSFKEAFLAHTQTYGIENIDYLFPDAKSLTNHPNFIKRDTGWVGDVINGTYHTPFARIKTVHADITAEAARAMGYVKGAMKKDEVIRLLKRTTTPTTVYKKQKLDRDDILDITDLDVVAWLKAEMRLMLDEELARAVLVGDGRDPSSADKINEENIRPVYNDDDMYAHKVQIDADAEIEDIIDEIVRARSNYKGSGNPTFFTTSAILSNMLLSKDTTGRRIYATLAELESALRVSKIVEVPVMESLSRTTDAPESVTLNLIGIIVNLKDYSLGADKGGAVSMFDDFDIDYNQYKYLMETRCSGALTLPKSALVIEQVAAAG